MIKTSELFPYRTSELGSLVSRCQALGFCMYNKISTVSWAGPRGKAPVMLAVEVLPSERGKGFDL